MTRDRDGQPIEQRVAETTAEAYAMLIPDEALESGDPRYVQLDAERGGSFARLLLTGHRGCGKTTELLRLRELLAEDGFAVVYFDAEAEFDLFKQDVSWWNVLLEMIWQMDTQLTAEPHNLSLPTQAKEDAAEWLARIVIKQRDRTELEASLQTELGADAGLPFFLKVKALFKSSVKTGSSRVTEVEKEVERRPEILLDAVDAIIRDVNEQLYLRFRWSTQDGKAAT